MQIIILVGPIRRPSVLMYVFVQLYMYNVFMNSDVLIELAEIVLVQYVGIVLETKDLCL